MFLLTLNVLLFVTNKLFFTFFLHTTEVNLCLLLVISRLISARLTYDCEGFRSIMFSLCDSIMLFYLSSAVSFPLIPGDSVARDPKLMSIKILLLR